MARVSSLSPSRAAAIALAAGRLGLAPAELTAIIANETAGTFDPGIWGGTKSKYFGLIQFGPTERAKYDVDTENPNFDAQLDAAVQFAIDRGFVPGEMDAPALYTTILAGNPFASQSKKSGNLTVAQWNAAIFSDSNISKMTGLLGDYSMLAGLSSPMVGNQPTNAQIASIIGGADTPAQVAALSSFEGGGAGEGLQGLVSQALASYANNASIYGAPAISTAPTGSAASSAAAANAMSGFYGAPSTPSNTGSAASSEAAANAMSGMYGSVPTAPSAIAAPSKSSAPTPAQIAAIIGGQSIAAAPAPVAQAPVSVDPSFTVTPGQNVQRAVGDVVTAPAGARLVAVMKAIANDIAAAKTQTTAQDAISNTLGGIASGIGKALSPGINSTLSALGYGPSYSPATASGLSPSMYGGPGTKGASNPSPSAYSFSFGGGPAGVTSSSGSGQYGGAAPAGINSSGSSMYGGAPAGFTSSSGSGQYGGSSPSSTPSSTVSSSGSAQYGGSSKSFTPASAPIGLGPVSFTTSSKTISVPNPAYSEGAGKTVASKATADAIAAGLTDAANMSLADISLYGSPLVGLTVDPNTVAQVAAKTTKAIPKTITKTIITKTPTRTIAKTAPTLAAPAPVAMVGGKPVTGYTPVGGIAYSAAQGSSPAASGPNGRGAASVYGYGPGGTSTTYGTSNGGSISMYSAPTAVGGSPTGYGMYGSQSGQPSVVSGSTGGAGVGTVLCTHYFRKGWLTRDMWKADTRYSMTLDPDMRAGYLAWAMPTVAYLKTGTVPAQILEAVLWPIVRAWSAEMAHRHDPKIFTGSLFGRVVLRTLGSACLAIGRRRSLALLGAQ